MTSLASVLLVEAKQRGVVIPTPATFAKYGWTRAAWLRMLADQKWVCPLCGKFPPSGRFVTDHEHVAGWSKMPPKMRARYIRGLTCWTDNRYLLARGITVERAERAAEYLRRYGERRPK